MEVKYRYNDRVEYMVRDGFTMRHRIGYVKQQRDNFFGTYYAICYQGDGARYVDVVPARNIFGLVADKQPNNK